MPKDHINRRVFLVTATAALALAAGCQETAAPSAAPAFADVAGSYTGQLVTDGGDTYDMVIRIAPDGSYNWVRDGEDLTDGRLSRQSNGEFRYRNDIGSRGVVTPSGNTLVWRNVFTGANYTVTVSR